MSALRRTGGDTVSAGNYWNFENSMKVTMHQEGKLPGKPSQSYYRAHPFIILSLAAAAAHVVIYVFPQMLMGAYARYVDQLIAAYVTSDYIFLGLVISGLAYFGLKDALGSKRAVSSFDWRPGMTYLAKTKKKNTRNSQ